MELKRLEQLDYRSTYAELGSELSTQLDPTPLLEPYLVHINHTLANRIGIDLTQTSADELTALFSGHGLLPSWKPLAMKYTGHQFGQYNPDLGDGRGLLLTEIIDSNKNKWDFHLKGSGQTPYSRGGDGRAVLRSSIREYLISAAMQGLGIPTTQALALVGSHTPVQREESEFGATLLRVSPSHIRFGHFEYLFYSGQHAKLQQLADHVIHWHMPEIEFNQNKYVLFFDNVVNSTASMIAKWHAYGFAHGVMNTDNMSILGLTFDYGPFAFLDNYQPDFICNHSDYSGRYAFNKQPGIAQWNLSALGYALSELIDKEAIEAALAHYSERLQSEYRTLMKERFGLRSEQEQDSELINRFLELMKIHQLDFNFTFRYLSTTPTQHWNEDNIDINLSKHDVLQWLTEYAKRLDLDYASDQERIVAMKQVNPKYILRTHLAEQVIQQVSNGDFKIINDWMTVLSDPFSEHSQFDSWSLPPADQDKGICLSCSS